MCTIVVLHQVRADLPLVVAANRDEFYARASLPPRVLSETPRIVGGVDVEKGGTWMGLTAQGLFVGVTNQRTYHPADRSKASRGQLVLDVLHAGSVDAARALLASRDGRATNAFNLVVGDGRSLFAAYARDDTPRIAIEPLAPGVHVIPNDVANSADFPKAARARRLLGGDLEALPLDTLRARLAHAITSHETSPLDAVREPPRDSPMTREFARELDAICVHTAPYGTCSATMLAVDARGGVAHYAFAPGPPCVTPFEDVTPLFA